MDKSLSDEERKAKIREANRMASAKYRASGKHKLAPSRQPEYWRDYRKKASWKAWRKDYYAKNQDKIKDYSRQWRLDNPERLAAAGAAYRETHREIQRKRTRDYFAAHPEVVCRQAAERRARKRKTFVASDGPAIERFFILAHSKEKHCYYCGKFIDGVADVDHAIPLARNGPHSSGNLVIACDPCNSTKLNKTPSEFTRLRVGQIFLDL